MQVSSALERLKKQRDSYNARIQMIEAREKVKERKLDTRRKILVGAYYLDVAKKENKLDSLSKLMTKFLTRDSDRALFIPSEAQENKV